ncbi:MAG TPA: DUF4402 domain-containing protein [Chitinophagales bacterium]|nr:DUF4402 domain-containing protein [Chitinophagales bacterium]
MIKCLKIAVCALLVCGSAISAFAQGSAFATASSSATIVTPIAITEVTNLDFGNVAVSALNAGSVTMPATSAGVRTVLGGVTLPSGGSHQAASFTVTGEGAYTFTVTLPSTDLDLASGSDHMQVNTFAASAGAGALTLGTQTIYVGAKLNVSAAQPAGSYISGTPFTVTVNYN